MKLIKRILIFLFVVLVFLILYENTPFLQQTSTFRFSLYLKNLRWASAPIPVWVIMVIAFVIGYAAAYIPGFVRTHAYKRKIKLLEAQVQTNKLVPSDLQDKDQAG